jgi:hypothetical protein
MTRHALLVAMAFAAGFGAGASASTGPDGASPGPRAPKVAVVVDAGLPGSGAAVEAARRGARAAGVTHRAPRTPYEQLSVTARLAAEGYTTIVGVGLEPARAIAPLDRRVRYAPVDPSGPGLAGRVAAAARGAR